MTLRKFLSQSESTRIRHAPRLVWEYERLACSLKAYATFDEFREHNPGLARLLSALAGQSWLTARARTAVTDLIDLLEQSDADSNIEPVCRGLNHVRHELQLISGRAADDKDFEPSEDAVGEDAPDAALCRRFDIGLFGESIRSPYNVGSMIRSAEAFGAACCVFSADSASADHPRAGRAAMGSSHYIPVRTAGFEEMLDDGWTVFAVELGGEPIDRFHFPDQGIAVFGNEELGLSDRVTEAVGRSAGVVSIPLYGYKASLNVASATAVLFSWWTTRLAERGL